MDRFVSLECPHCRKTIGLVHINGISLVNEGRCFSRSYYKCKYCLGYFIVRLIGASPCSDCMWRVECLLFAPIADEETFRDEGIST